MKSMIKARFLLTITLVAVLVLIGGKAPAQVMAPTREVVYVEPALFSVEAENLSVIVTAGDSQAAARAVERAGGQVTSDLWLIDAVAAMIPARQLETLAAYPGIRSVVNNKSIQTADGPDDDGWVTDIRVQRGVHILEAVQYTPAACLPDGGSVSIDEKGTVLIVNADGSERALVSLSGGPFRTAAVVSGADGTIYVAGEAKLVYALNPDGSTLWVFDGVREKILASVALGLDGTVYVVDEERNVYALDPATGKMLWQFFASGDGPVKTSPGVGLDGTVYVVSEKGYLFAINPDGSSKWTFIAKDGAPFKHSPQVGADGTIYIAGEEKRVFAVNPNGSLKYEFATASKILAQPALAADGSLYVAAEDRSLYGVNPDGTERFLFRPAAGKFKTSPVLSPDGESVYAAVEEGRLFAVDAASGAERWRYTTIEKIQASPALDATGNVIVGSEGRDLVILSPKGVSLYSTSLSDKITQSASVSPSGNVNVRVGDRTVVALGRLPDHWDGRPDVQPTESKRIWQLVNPVAVDVGADVLHRQGLTGQGVTVAVVDSGVYFDKEVKTELGPQVERLFLGQADFVDSICETYQQNRNRISVFGTQYDGYCFTDSEHSKDAYGHGTHIAGSVWNNFADYTTGVAMGIAPDARVLSVRVLGGDGRGTYEDVIRGIQYVVENKDAFNIRVLNLSLSAYATTPYFVDPLNRAAEAAWAHGIVVLAAAGNTGPAAESITVPGNDPYVITVGAVDSNRTPGYWADDFLPSWSAAGPTLDGFLKPDVLAPGANIVSFMYNDPDDIANSAWLVQQHPDYSETTSLFRMSGTSMATAAASGVVALMLQEHPELTPDQIKFRLAHTARAADTEEDDLVYNIFQQGVGRIWAPEAVLGDLPTDGVANGDTDINADLAHGWEIDEDLLYHYEGPVQKLLSDDGLAYLYYVVDEDGNNMGLGVAWEEDLTWVDQETLSSGRMAWSGGQMTLSSGMSWAGGLSWAAGRMAWSGGRMAWSGGRMAWSGGRMAWSGGRMAWSGGRMAWSGGRMAWSGGLAWAGGRMAWSGGLDTDSACVSTTTWVDEWQVDD